MSFAVAPFLLYILTIFFSFSAIAESVSIESLNKLIVSSGLKTVDEVIPLLPESYRKNYVLVYQSHSLQNADPLHPRVLMFGDDARTVLAITAAEIGDNQRIEAMRFDEHRNAFDFFEADFSKPQKTFANKAICASCHFADSRPNWQPYSIWAGVYGSDDDDVRSPRASSPTEYNDWLILLRDFASRPRYRELISSAYSRPNSLFTELLAELNFKRLRRLVRATPDFDKFKYAIAGSIDCQLEANMLEFNEFLPRRMQEPGVKWAYFDMNSDGTEKVSAFRHLFESRGIDMSSWSMTFLPSDSMFNHDFATPFYFYYSMAAALFDGDPDLAPYLEFADESYRDHSGRTARASEFECRSLAAKSRSALEGYRSRGVLRRTL